MSSLTSSAVIIKNPRHSTQCLRPGFCQNSQMERAMSVVSRLEIAVGRLDARSCLREEPAHVSPLRCPKVVRLNARPKAFLFSDTQLDSANIQKTIVWALMSANRLLFKTTNKSAMSAALHSSKRATYVSFACPFSLWRMLDF